MQEIARAVNTVDAYAFTWFTIIRMPMVEAGVTPESATQAATEIMQKLFKYDVGQSRMFRQWKNRQRAQD
jgi:hypothetical protein